MDEARVARALNCLGEDAFHFGNDSEYLLELVDEYFGDTTLTGKIRPNPTVIITHVNYYNNVEEELEGDVEEIDHDQELEPEDETTTTPTADELVSASVCSGAQGNQSSK